MTIKYLGHASFLIKTKTARIVTDPFDPKMVGLKFPKVEADVVTVSHEHEDHNAASQVGGDPLIVNMPGEYEKQGARIFGIKSYHDTKKGEERGENTLFKIEADGVSVLHCGDLGVMPDEATLDEIGDVDVVLIPTGGFYTIGPEEATQIARKLEATVIIPMHYQQDGLNLKVFEKLVPVSEFVKKMGVEAPAPVDVFDAKHEDLEQSAKIVIMNPTG